MAPGLKLIFTTTLFYKLTSRYQVSAPLEVKKGGKFFPVAALFMFFVHVFVVVWRASGSVRSREMEREREKRHRLPGRVGLLAVTYTRPPCLH